MTMNIANNSRTDADILLDSQIDMTSHLDALRKLDPKIAGEIEATWRATQRAITGTQARSMAARLILGGAYDKIAYDIIADAGAKSIVNMMEGNGGSLSPAVKRAVDANPMLKALFS